MKILELVKKIIMASLAVFGWFFLGLSIFSSFTVLPLCLGLAFMESGGPISSGDQGLQVPVMLFLCVVPGILGTAMLIARKWRQKIPLKLFVKRCSILLAIQFAAFVLAFVLTPEIGTVSQDAYIKNDRPNSEAIENLKRFLHIK